MNKFVEKYNCILCKYNKYNKDGDSCIEHQEKDEYGYPIGKCKSLSNIYYGNLIKCFPFKQVHNIRTEIVYKKEERFFKKMNEKYGDCLLEDDNYKFIWGIKAYDDLSMLGANLYTMNDIDIVYDKEIQSYILTVETAYDFEGKEAECDYLRYCLKNFTKYMDDNGLEKNKEYMLFMSDCCTNVTADTIEELYMNFKIFVDGFCKAKGA